jgi:hypothetical protein
LKNYMKQLYCMLSQINYLKVKKKLINDRYVISAS